MDRADYSRFAVKSKTKIPVDREGAKGLKRIEGDVE
jgi:hypothetical protein